MVLVDTVNWVTCPKLSRSRFFLSDFVLRGGLGQDQMRILRDASSRASHASASGSAFRAGQTSVVLFILYLYTWGLSATKRLADGEASMHQGSVIYNTTLSRSTCQCRGYTDDLPTYAWTTEPEEQTRTHTVLPCRGAGSAPGSPNFEYIWSIQ